MNLNFKDIKKFVLKHDRQKIAEQHKVSISLVYAVGSGKRRNVAILDSLIAIAELNKRKLEELEKRTQKLQK